MKVEPGWRRETIARLYCDWLYERPPTMARISPVRGSIEMSAASALPFRLRRESSWSTLVRPVADGVLREALQVQVERRVDLHRLGVGRRQPGIFLVERLADVVDEVGRLGLERALHHRERLFLRASLPARA